MSEEQKLWGKLSKAMERFTFDTEPLIQRLKELGRQYGATDEREKKKLYMREWMRKKREKERAEQTKAEQGEQVT